MFGHGRIFALAAALALATPALAAHGGDSGTHGSHGGGTHSGTHHTGGTWTSGHHGTGGTWSPGTHGGGSAFGPEYGHGQVWGRSHNHAFDTFHRAYNARSRFHGGAYYHPHGWYYRRWNYGEFLPALFFAQTYWLMNYGTYDLPPPPPGCVWARYGSDALLVDRATGEIVQVVYGVFY